MREQELEKEAIAYTIGGFILLFSLFVSGIAFEERQKYLQSQEERHSLKDRFLERAYALKKPFYFLLPLTALEGVRRGRLFRKYGINLIVFDRRVEFMDKGSVWFATGWFFWSPYKENNRIYFKELPCKS